MALSPRHMVGSLLLLLLPYASRARMHNRSTPVPQTSTPMIKLAGAAGSQHRSFRLAACKRFLPENTNLPFARPSSTAWRASSTWSLHPLPRVCTPSQSTSLRPDALQHRPHPVDTVPARYSAQPAARKRAALGTVEPLAQKISDSRRKCPIGSSRLVRLGRHS